MARRATQHTPFHSRAGASLRRPAQTPNSRPQRVTLATGVLLLPLYHPMMVAEEGAMVDMISGGRLILGIGAGYAPEEFSAFGYSLKERGSRLEEGASLLRRLWTE